MPGGLLLSPVPEQNLDSNPSCNPSPSEDLHHTIETLLDANSYLKGKVEELEGDKRHFQEKLDAYIRFDVEEKATAAEFPISTINSERADIVVKLEREVEYSRREINRLSDLLINTGKASDKENTGGCVRGESHLAHPESTPGLLNQLRQLQAAHFLCVSEHRKKMELVNLENFRQREEIARLKRTLEYQPGLKNHRHSQEKIIGNSQRNVTGLSGLSESLISLSSGSCSKTEKYSGPGTFSTVSSGSSFTSGAGHESVAALELKKLKKQLEKYKTANIELDQKLKGVSLELQRYSEQQGDWDIPHQMDIERLKREESILKSQLDRALRENSQLRSMVGRQRF